MSKNNWPEDHPIKPHKSWSIRDASKTSTAATCFRKYYYEYILGWRLDAPNQDLVFGEAWHRAKEHMLLTGNKDIDGAMGEFLLYYREHFTEATDMDYHPKSPGNAYTGLKEYQSKYGTDEFEVVIWEGKPLTEIHGVVHIDENRIVDFRMDAIVNTDSGKKFIDHKTSKALAKWWADQFSLSIQMGLYTHAINCIFPGDSNGGMVDGSIFRKMGNAHERVPIRRSFPMMQDWLWTFTEIMDGIEKEMGRLAECVEGHAVLMSFPKNPEGCFKYMRTCIFHDFCTAWENPIKRSYEPPQGFKQEWWDPAERHTATAKHHFELPSLE